MRAGDRERSLERLDRAAARVEPVFVAVAGIAAAAVILFVTGPHGPALSPDSAAYLSAAESFADGEGLTKYGGEVMVNFPPGFPLLLAALVELFDASAVAAGRVANAVLLGLITGAAWLVLRRLATSATIRLLGVTVVASATSLHLVSSYAWSEPLFVFTSLFALLALNEAIRRPYDVGWLVVAALAAGSCFLIRYIGVVRHRHWERGHTRRGLAAALRSAAADARRGVRGGRERRAGRLGCPQPLGVRHHYGRTTGRRKRRSRRTPTTRCAAWVCSWCPRRPPCAGWCCYCCVRSPLRRSCRSGRQAWEARGDSRGCSRASSLCTWSYWSSAPRRTSVYPLKDRLLSPIFVPLVALAAALLDRAAVGWRERHGPYWALLGPGALALCAAGLVWGSAEVGSTSADGVDYAGQRWRDSDLIATVKRTDLPATVYSNVPGGLFLRASIDARCWPHELVLGDRCNGFATTSDGVEEQIGTDPAALIVFSPDRAGERPTVEIPDTLRVTRTIDTTDGSMYLLRPAENLRHRQRAEKEK